jgi:hypothetical protein
MTRKGPAPASRPRGEAGGARRDGDDLSYNVRLAHSSTSLALEYRAEAWRYRLSMDLHLLLDSTPQQR